MERRDWMQKKIMQGGIKPTEGGYFAYFQGPMPLADRQKDRKKRKRADKER